jgi:photosystem II stability/assembly factor-like uncharacterized protein
MRWLLVPLTVAAGALLVAVGTAATPAPPNTVKASLIKRQRGTLKPGSTVSSTSLGTRTFVNDNDGFALASTQGADYPAATTDGGKNWKTDGPALHVAALQAPLSVLYVGAVNLKTIYAYGGGQTVDVTSDGGKTWWRAFLGDYVAAVVPGFGHRLVAFEQTGVGPNGSKAVALQYVSKDGGKNWHFSTAFAGG